MSKVYLIEDSSGYYEDSRTSIIKAFNLKIDAIEYRDKYNGLLTKLRDHVEQMHHNIPHGEYYESCFQYRVSDQHQCTLIEIELL